MSDRQISAGDVVVVVRTAVCGCQNSLARFFRVSLVVDAGNICVCIYCGSSWRSKISARLPDGNFCELYRLKRIPPLADLESTDQQQELTA